MFYTIVFICHCHVDPNGFPYLLHMLDLAHFPVARWLKQARKGVNLHVMKTEWEKKNHNYFHGVLERGGGYTPIQRCTLTILMIKFKQLNFKL